MSKGDAGTSVAAACSVDVTMISSVVCWHGLSYSALEQICSKQLRRLTSYRAGASEIDVITD